MLLIETASETDETLARQARAGSLGSFDQLVRRYQVPLLQFLRRRMPGRQDHADVIQEAFLRAYQSLNRFRDDQPFKPWLFTIAYRISIDAGRRWWPLRMVSEEHAQAIGQGPLHQVSVKDEKDHLWQVVRRVLSDESFTAVWLFYGESMATEQIAEILGRSRDWVKTALLRARAKIKVEIEQGEL